MTSNSSTRLESSSDIAAVESCKIESWLLSIDDRSVEYWSDPENEKGKVFDVSDGDLEKLEQDRHLIDIFNNVQALIQLTKLKLDYSKILSLASGVCWLEARLLKNTSNFELTALDYAKHRIHRLAPEIFQWYGLGGSHINLVHGSMLELRLEDQSQDVVLLSQAFHHTCEPYRLLTEIKRVLREDGTVLIVGEHYFDSVIQIKQTIKHFIKWVLNYQDKYRSVHRFVPDYQSLFPRSFEKGDIHYPMVEYDALFTGAGFTYERYVHKPEQLQSFVLRKDTKRV